MKRKTQKLKTSDPRQSRGSVILLVLIVVTALSLGMASVLKWNLTERKLNQRHLLRTQAHYAVESVLEHGFSQLQQRFVERISFPSDSLAPDKDPLKLPGPAFFSDTTINIQGLAIHGSVIPPGTWTFIDPTNPANTFDPLAGRMVLARNVVILGKAQTAKDGHEINTYGIQQLQIRDAPLFSNAIFYNMDLEIAPGPNMLIHGSVHSNRDLYIQSGNSLRFHDRLTTSGQIFHGRKPHSGQSTSFGEVSASSGKGGLKSFQVGSQWLQSSTPNWRALAVERWQGTVQTVEHGVQPHNPVAIGSYEPDDPYQPGSQLENPAIALIQPAHPSGNGPSYNSEVEEQKFAVKAGLYIEWNPAGGLEPDNKGKGKGNNNASPAQGPLKAYTREGQSVTLPPGLITTSPGLEMYDARRTRSIHVADLDVGFLKQLIENPDPNDPNGHIQGFDPDRDWNGIVYLEAKNLANTGVRLVNGSQVPNHGTDAGFTFATNNALYVLGHYNADGDPQTGGARDPDNSAEPPAALIGDAVTFLSDNWDDSQGNINLNQRNSPSYTEIAAAILTGIAPTDNNRYSGGVENLPRLLENWSGQTLTIRGSMVVLFESEVAKEPWSFGGKIYRAPNRDWGFNLLFSKGIYPPGTPNTRTFRRTYFREISRVRYDTEYAKLQEEP